MTKTSDYQYGRAFHEIADRIERASEELRRRREYWEKVFAGVRADNEVLRKLQKDDRGNDE